MTTLFKIGYSFIDVRRASEIISDLLKKEKQTNPFLKRIDPEHFALCLRATYLNHHSAYLTKDAIEVVAACIFHDLSKDVNYIELIDEFSIAFAKAWTGKCTKFVNFLNRMTAVNAVAIVMIGLAIVHFLSR